MFKYTDSAKAGWTKSLDALSKSVSLWCCEYRKKKKPTDLIILMQDLLVKQQSGILCSFSSLQSNSAFLQKKNNLKKINSTALYFY